MAAKEDALTSWGRGAEGGEGKLQVTLRNRRSPAVVLKRCVQIRYENLSTTHRKITPQQMSSWDIPPPESGRRGSSLTFAPPQSLRQIRN